MGRTHPVRSAIGLLVFLALVMMLMTTSQSAHGNPVYMEDTGPGGTVTEILDVSTRIDARLLPAQNSPSPGTGAYPEFNDIVDVRPATPGLQILDGRVHPQYQLRAYLLDGQATEVLFQYWNGSEWFPSFRDPQSGFYGVSADGSRAWTYMWDAPLLDNRTASSSEVVYWRAIAWQGDSPEIQYDRMFDEPTADNGPDSLQPVWELKVEVIDATAPSSCLSQIGGYSDPASANQMIFPRNAQVTLVADVTDNDGDPLTTDIANVRFEYTPIGRNQWIALSSVTWHGAEREDMRSTGATMTVEPVVGTDGHRHLSVPWESGAVPAGTYEIRVVATDIEGNSSVLTCCVYTVQIQKR